MSVEAVASRDKRCILLPLCASVSKALAVKRWTAHVTGVCAAGGASVIAIEMRWVGGVVCR